ncbi:hypothetical protein TNCV_4048891 [Trichonephila clavipes]|nr:hypothetical protein TNCV_4048891 [Trichonephila clavipes]
MGMRLARISPVIPVALLKYLLILTKSESIYMAAHKKARRQGRKPVSAEAIQKVVLQVEEDNASNGQASTSVRRVEEALDLPRSTVQKIMRNILCYYP